MGHTLHVFNIYQLINICREKHLNVAIQNIPAPCNTWNHEISISSPLIHTIHLPGYGGLSETTHVGIYTLSTLVEQSTPAILEIVDAYATVMGTFFVDKARWQMAMGMGFTT